MQVEGTGEENAGAPKGAAGRGSTISLHPLVIINISDHSTRFRALNGGNAKRVLGVLLGKLVPRMRILVGLCRPFLDGACMQSFGQPAPAARASRCRASDALCCAGEVSPCAVRSLN